MLTPRDAEFVKLLLRGKSNRQIGLEPGITEGSVKMAFHRIFRKLQVHTRCELMAEWGPIINANHEDRLDPKTIAVLRFVQQAALSVPRTRRKPTTRRTPVSDEEMDRRAIALGVR